MTRDDSEADLRYFLARRGTTYAERRAAVERYKKDIAEYDAADAAIASQSRLPPMRRIRHYQGAPARKSVRSSNKVNICV